MTTISLSALIAQNIDAAIAAKGLTNRQVGDSVGTTHDHVSRWRRGHTTPSHEYLPKLAALLADGDVSWFYRVHDQTEAAKSGPDIPEAA